MDGEGDEARKLQEWFKPNDHVAFNVVYGTDGEYPLFIHFGVGYFTLVICGTCGAARDKADCTSAETAKFMHKHYWNHSTGSSQALHPTNILPSPSTIKLAIEESMPNVSSPLPRFPLVDLVKMNHVLNDRLAWVDEIETRVEKACNKCFVSSHAINCCSNGSLIQIDVAKRFLKGKTTPIPVLNAKTVGFVNEQRLQQGLSLHPNQTLLALRRGLRRGREKGKNLNILRIY